MEENFDKPDTTAEELMNVTPEKIEGLYFYCNGDRLTPARVYFGIDYAANGCVGGQAFCHYACALRPVYQADGTRLERPHLRNVIAKYDGVMLSGYYKE